MADALAARLAENDDLDRRSEAVVREAETTIRNQQQKLSALDEPTPAEASDTPEDQFESPARESGDDMAQRAPSDVTESVGDGRDDSHDAKPVAPAPAAPAVAATAARATAPPAHTASGVAPPRAGAQPGASKPARRPRARDAPVPGADRAGANRAHGSSEAVDAPPLEEDVPEATGMGAEAAARYSKARAQVLSEELERVRVALAKAASEGKAWELRASEATSARAKLERAAKDSAARAEREARAAAEQRERADALEQQLGAHRRDAEGTHRDTKQRLADAKAKDVRLNRALEELERTKAALAQAQQDARAAGGGGGAHAERQQLSAENGRLRKQKAELLLAFKKQAKLIDVLKRQKLHVEAARTLQFTEEEFSKTLRLGENGGS